MPEQPNPHDVRPLTAERLTQLARVTSVAPSPDGSWLAVAVSRLDTRDAKYVSDLWRVSLSTRRAARAAHPRASNDVARRLPARRRLGFLSTAARARATRGGRRATAPRCGCCPPAAASPCPLTDEPLGVPRVPLRRRGDRLVSCADVLPGVPPDEQRKTALAELKHGPTARHLPPHARPLLGPLDARAGAARHGLRRRGRRRRDLTPEADREYRDASWDLSRDGERSWPRVQRPGADRVEDAALWCMPTDGGDARVLGARRRVPATSTRVLPGRHIRSPVGRHERRDGALGRAGPALYDVGAGEGRPVVPDWERWPTRESAGPPTARPCW